ncbi:MAG: ABC transporter permease [SAR202 cluster bacterium]|jgi:peptide/nickel transport system permease protein|nr:MAG: ABC transporter permease [SAR202 cluster bacterium]KAA1304571.1 MAG: ABC transporter permease [SAR202 cluster bacterium]MEC8986450.1 ABC transporter permease [Chloroflexota bacterium]MED5410334.1 ABC transporter permease [Chloroflexota bacterium]MEE3346189.1 ABC transporter permease [Chloroflexota bacterium]
MRQYILRRLLLLPPTLLLLGTILFFMVQSIPGDVASALLAGEENAVDPKTLEKFREDLGLTEPLIVQYGKWLAQTATGDLGYSYYFSKPVWEVIKPKIETTLTLAIFGVLIAIVLALPAGVFSALFRGSWFDQFVRTISAAGMAVPAFWLGIIILLILSRIFGWMAPVIHSSIFDNPIEAFQRYLFPSLILGFRSAAVISRMVRSMMLEVLSEDYVRTAWAKGLQPRSVIIGHALRNALLPVVTMLGMLFASLIDGAVVLETVFNLPGIGLLMVDSVIARDPGMVLGLVLSIGIFMMIWILLIDLSYKVLDPRVEYD